MGLERGEILGSLHHATVVDKKDQLEDVTATEPHHIPCVATRIDHEER